MEVSLRKVYICKGEKQCREHRRFVYNVEIKVQKNKTKLTLVKNILFPESKISLT